MKRLLCVFSIVAFVSTLGLSTWDLAKADACGTSFIPFWDPDCTETSSEGTGKFALYPIVLKWDAPSTPGMMAVSVSSKTSGISNVTYTPSFFFPSSCTGSKNIKIVGDTSGDEEWVTTIGGSGAPNTDIHTLFVDDPNSC